MQTLYVPKYNLHYRVNPKDPCELQWSRKPFGPMTQWQHAMSFKKPIRALDLDDKTKQGVVVLNDSSTYVGSGVRTWGRKFYPAGTRIYSLYAIGESKMTNKILEQEKDPEWDKFYHDVKVFIGKYYIKNIVEWIRKRGNTIEDDEGNKFLNMVATYYDEERSVAMAAKLLSDWVTTNDWQHTDFDDGKIDRQIMLFDKPSESKVKSKMKISVHEAQEFHKAVASGLNFDDACFVQEEMQEFANNNGYAAKVRVHNDGSDNFSIVIKSTDESDLTRLPDDFDLDSVIAELQEPSVHKELDKSDLSHTFSDDYIDREVGFIKGRPWDVNASNRFCDKLNAYIDTIDADDDGNDILYIKNDEDGFEITVTIGYGIDNDADRVVDAKWNRI